MSTSISKSVRLADLDYDPVVLAMPGQEARLGEVGDLIASIAAEGVLQSLKVRTSPEADRYYVTAGLRRLTALKFLRDGGGKILGQVVTDETSVPVVYSEESDDTARRQAVAENVQRVALTVGAEVRQFRELARTSTPKDIAKRFGVTEKRVAQRLKLGALHADVLDALDAGKITIAAAEAFTYCDDPDEQAKYLKGNAKSSWNLTPESIKRQFVQDLVTSKSFVGELIGREAYEAAGGQFLENPYAGQGEDYWISPDVITVCLPAAWERWKAARLEEGWQFVETREEFGQEDGGRIWGIWSGGSYAFSDEDRAAAGIIYDPTGTKQPNYGVLRVGAKRPGQADDTPVVQQVPSLTAIPNPLFEAMCRAANKAMRTTIVSSPLMALQLVVASLHASIVTEYQSDVIDIGATGHETDLTLTGEPPAEEENIWPLTYAWVAGQSQEELLANLAALVSQTVNISRYVPRDELNAVGDFLNPDLLAAFDAEAYFAGLGKPLVALAYEDITGKTLKDGKLETMAGKALVEARAQGWLPPQLRTKHYAGPRHITPAVAEEPAPEDQWDEDEDDESLQAAE